MDKHPCTVATEELAASRHNNPRLDPLFHLMGSDEATWVLDEVQRWWEANGEHFENDDNRRLAQVGDAASEAMYEVIRQEGCCGSVDVVLGPSPVTGKSYRFGFNYGH